MKNQNGLFLLNNRFIIILFLVNLCLFTILSPKSSHGSTAVYSSIKTVSIESEVIIHAYVANISTNKDNKGRPITHVALEVIDGIKGLKSGSLTILSQLGGEIDGMCYKISGAKQFKFGEEIILFADWFNNTLITYGSGLGLLRINNSAEGKIAFRDLDPNILVDNKNYKINDYHYLTNKTDSLKNVKNKILEYISSKILNSNSNNNNNNINNNKFKIVKPKKALTTKNLNSKDIK